MARKRPGDPSISGLIDAAGSLASYAAGFLARPEYRSREVLLKLGRVERVLLIDLPGLDGTLKGRIDVPSAAPRSFRFTMDELARACLALSDALLDAEGRDAVRLLKLAGKVTDSMNRAAGDLKGAGKPPRATPKTKGATSKVYQLKITLKDIRPPIWRRVLVADCSLAKLHEVIQAAMGWEDYHLYDFEAGGDRYSDPRGMDDLDMEDAGRVKLSQIAPMEKAKLRYTYDFGDNWQHEVLVEKILPPEEGQTYPVCIAGERACPPEDVGGPWDYMEFAEAIRDPEHERYEEFLEWRGEFDPEAFDLDAVNQGLRRLRERPA
jgi:hypothetical protein